ncbi:MAG: family 16 glycoside hydrolase, partial [bacterium]
GLALYKSPLGYAVALKPEGRETTGRLFDLDGKWAAGALARTCCLLVFPDGVEIPAPTGAGQPESPEPGSLRLQDHGNAVLYRNVWIVPQAPETGAVEAGFTPLFDAAHADGWEQAGPGGFDVKDGVATARGGMGLWYYAKKSYADFILTLEFQQEKPDANSGVFVRFPRVEGDPMKPVNEGYEIQICADTHDVHALGAIYSFQAPSSLSSLKPPHEWNTYEIACVGQAYTVKLNGVVINSYTGSRSLAGMIGVQNHSDTVRFRNIRIRELSAAK